MIHLVSSKRDHSSVFRVQDVHVKINTLKFSIRDSKHDFLYKTLRPLATGLIKRQIQKAIKDTLITGFEYIDGQLVAVRDRMESAQATEDVSRTEILKDVSLIYFLVLIHLADDSLSNSSLPARKSPVSNLANTSHNSRLWLIRGNHSFLMRGALLDGLIVLLRKKSWLRKVVNGDRMREFE